MALYRFNRWVTTCLSLWKFVFGFYQLSVKVFFWVGVIFLSSSYRCVQELLPLMSLTLKYHMKWTDFCIYTSQWESGIFSWKSNFYVKHQNVRSPLRGIALILELLLIIQDWFFDYYVIQADV